MILYRLSSAAVLHYLDLSLAPALRSSPSRPPFSRNVRTTSYSTAAQLKSRF